MESLSRESFREETNELQLGVNLMNINLCLLVFFLNQIIFWLDMLGLLVIVRIFGQLDSLLVIHSWFSLIDITITFQRKNCTRAEITNTHDGISSMVMEDPFNNNSMGITRCASELGNTSDNKCNIMYGSDHSIHKTTNRLSEWNRRR